MPIRIINTPSFYFIRDFFTGDNLGHYLPAKYLWTVCNVTKKGFYQPVYDVRLDGPVTIDFMFYPEQPQHKYFKKPAWLNEFSEAKDVDSARLAASQYDFFVNNCRYRGANPVELNWGCPPNMPALDLYLVAYSYKAVYEEGVYLDDLVLADEYSEYLDSVKRAINPERRPVIALHQRGNDPWKRHLPNSAELSEILLNNLLSAYPDHVVVLLGESWRYHRHPRIKYLDDYTNLHILKKRVAESSACLQYILAAFFCRDADLVFCGVSGFGLFIERIRPLDRTPPIPIFWGPETFTGHDTCLATLPHWSCKELETYRESHPEDAAFQWQGDHFMYYSRNETLLKPYCLDYPNTVDKIFFFLSRLTGSKEHNIEIRDLPQTAFEKIVSILWRLKPVLGRLRLICQIVFVERSAWARLKAKLRRVSYRAVGA